MNRLDHFRRDRLDVSAVGELRIGHDRGRIRVHEHDLVAFLAQRFAGLHAGIIKLAALPDHDRTGPDEQNFFELIVPRHLRGGGNEDRVKRAGFHAASRVWHRHPAVEPLPGLPYATSAMR